MKQSSQNPTIINQKDIGALIARGGDLSVYHYGNSQVIKYSRRSSILGLKHREKMIYDYNICKKYFHNYIVTTNVVSGHTQYIEIQDYIVGSMFQKKHLHHKKITTQLKDIVNSVVQMQNDGYCPIDLIGGLGVIRPYFANIIVDKDNNLKIIDAMLFESKSMGGLGYIFEPLFWIARKIQEYKLKKLIISIDE